MNSKTKMLYITTVKYINKQKVSTNEVQDNIQRYQDSILHSQGDKDYITNDNEFNQFFNENIPAPDKNVYSYYRDNRNDDSD